ncbi:MAG: CHAT domain-containing protein [Granulicella sp.]
MTMTDSRTNDTSTRSPLDWQGGVPWDDFFLQHGTPGGAELFFATSGLGTRVGELVVAAMVVVRRADDDRPAYPYINIILPPNGKATSGLVSTWIANAFTHIRGGQALNAEELAIINRRVRITVTADLRIQSVVAEIWAPERPTLNVVIEAARYRDEGTDIVFDPAGPWKTNHDLWAPHLASMVKALVDKVRSTESMVLIEVGEDLPPNADARKLFDDMDEVGYAAIDNSTMAAVFDLAKQCLDLAIAGQLRQALTNVDSADMLAPEQKVTIKVQVLNRSGHSTQAVAEIRAAFDTGIKVDDRTLLGFASIAYKAAEGALAQKILSKVPIQMLGEEALELVLKLARELGMDALADVVAELLHQRWPAESGLRDETLDALKDLCAPTEPSQTRSVHGFPLEIRNLARWLYSAFDTPLLDLDNLLNAGRTVAGSHSAAMQLCLAYGMSQRGLTDLTLAMANPSSLSGRAARFAASLLIAAMERYLLNNLCARAPVELLSDAGLDVIRYLALHPEDHSTTAMFARVLAPETSGHIGLVLLIHSAVHLAKLDVGVTDMTGIKDVEPASNDQVMQFLKASITSLAATGNVLNSWIIPDELLVPSADALLAGLVVLIDESQRHDRDEVDRQMLNLLGGIGVAVARRSSSPNTDLTILRIWGGRVASAHSPQQGRDLAQALLESAGDAPVRRRLAWFGYGDIYLRGRNTLEGLLGLCCAMATRAALPIKESADEIGALMRALRDAGMVDLSDNLVPIWTSIMEQAGAGARDFNRAETARLSTGMRRILTDRSHIAAQLPALVQETSENLAKAIELDDNPLPAALSLGQLLNAARTFNVDVASDASETLSKARERLAGLSAEVFDLVVGVPTTAKLAHYTRSLDRARFAGDVGHDVEVVTLVARRLLSDPHVQQNAEFVLYASELLTELGLTPVSDSTDLTELPAWWPETVDAPAKIAKTISQRGVDVVVLASNSDDRVICCVARNGQLHIPREIADLQFSMSYFRTWSHRFPFEYGLDRSALDNTFFDTMERLQPCFDLNEPTVFICDTRLQQLPPNLFMHEGNFAGRQQPVAMAPSLTWLSRAKATLPRSFGPPVAWVSDGADPDADNTLNFLASLLQDTCNKYGIALERSTTPPAALAQAELAIVGAHGGLSDGERFFRVVADEGDTRMTARTLSEALDRCNVAVLFVCSGGRMDRHPLSNSVLGLPKELLNGGQQAVIASPWPLHVSVPAHWLGAFLDAWNNGDTLIVANFKANQEVARRSGDNPAHCLAMTVYGNPLIKKGRL